MYRRFDITIQCRDIQLYAASPDANRLGNRRWLTFVVCLTRMPTRHLDVLDPIFMVDSLPGGRRTGGGWYPPAEVGNWHDKEAITGVSNEDLDTIVRSDANRGIVAVTVAALEASIAHLSLMHEIGHCIDFHLGLIPSPPRIEDFAGQRYPRPSIREYAAEAYSRVMCSPSRICRTGSIPEGENMWSCGQRILRTLRRSPAFQGLESWSPGA